MTALSLFLSRHHPCAFCFEFHPVPLGSVQRRRLGHNTLVLRQQPPHPTSNSQPRVAWSLARSLPHHLAGASTCGTKNTALRSSATSVAPPQLATRDGPFLLIPPARPCDCETSRDDNRPAQTRHPPPLNASSALPRWTDDASPRHRIYGEQTRPSWPPGPRERRPSRPTPGRRSSTARGTAMCLRGATRPTSNSTTASPTPTPNPTKAQTWTWWTSRSCPQCSSCPMTR